MFAALLALALASDVQSETVRSGTARDRVATDDADLVIFYTSEQQGKLGTCGCAANPRGGFARLAGYLGAVERLGPGTGALLVNAGRWASDRIGDTLDLRADAVFENETMLFAAEQIGFDALNISYRDAPWLRDRPVPELLISANAADRVQAARFVEVGELTVAITGVSRAGSTSLQPEDFQWEDPVAALSELVPELRERADLVVVLAFETGADTKRIAGISGVDVVVEAGGYNGRSEPSFEGGTVWVQSRDEGLAVGELRLWIEDGQVRAVHDRWVDLDYLLPESAPFKRLERRTDRERLQVMRSAGLVD